MEGNAAVKLYKSDKLTEEQPESYTIQLSTNGQIFNSVAIDGKKPAVAMGDNKAGYLGTDLASITAATVNDLRKAIAVQQYYEALARGGSRYREQVQALWDVVISDKTVQIPEYLGGGRYHVNMNQIVQTSGQQSNTVPLS